MRLISWNVARALKKVPELVEALGNRDPDIVAFQEVNAHAAPLFEKEFARIGLPYVAHTLQDSFEGKLSGVLIASRFALNLLTGLPQSELWPEGLHSTESDSETLTRHWSKRMLFVTINSPWGEIDLYNVYITPYYSGERLPDGRPYHRVKLELLAGLYKTLSSHTNRLRILCGDFNTPQEERSNGEIITWGYEKKKNGDYKLTKPYQHELEINILSRLKDYDLLDVYRSIHGYANSGSDEAISHVQVRQNKRTGEKHLFKWRYDHVFASKKLLPQSAQYLHNLGMLKLSDHTPIEAVFSAQGG